MKLLNGKNLADALKEQYKETVKRLGDENHSVSLAVIQVGNDSASNVYVRNKERACEYVGIKSMVYKLDENSSEETIIDLIDSLNIDTSVNGILVQLPLPKHINAGRVLNHISPYKDVDGFHESNVGKVMLGQERFVPCTALGIVTLLRAYDIDIAGKNCVVVGRSDIVGKPTAMELLHNNGTVTICHSVTKNLTGICKSADILVCAIGKPKYFDKEYVSPDTVVIDVGIHRGDDGKMCGDVDFDDVKDIVSAITPVPKGVGAMTVAMLLHNCIHAAQMQYGLEDNYAEKS